jgi:hypothetical protein
VTIARLHPDQPLAGLDDLMGAVTGQLLLASRGIRASDFLVYLGVNPEALKQLSKETADEEFEHQHGRGPLAEARLRGLSASQRQKAHTALVETFEVAWRAAMVLAYVRAGAIGAPPQEVPVVEDRDDVRTRLEYLLYLVVLRHPDVLDEVVEFERIGMTMLTADQAAGDRARELAVALGSEQVHGR